MEIILIGLFVALLFFGFYFLNQSKLQVHRQNLINTYQFPQKLTDEVAKRYPHLSNSELEKVIESLRRYFHICNDANKQLVSMPSQVVDVAWHEFILFTKEYEHFCKKALGRFLHHTPAEAMSAPTVAQDGIKRAWLLSCQREGINSKAPTRLPILFALDDSLNIDDGFKYSLDCVKEKGKPYCAGHIGCSGSGCGGSGDSASDGGGGGCGGGCGGS